METKSYTSAVERGGIDEGLRGFMVKVYNYMAAGLCLTALVAYLIANTSLIEAFFNINQADIANVYSEIEGNEENEQLVETWKMICRHINGLISFIVKNSSGSASLRNFSQKSYNILALEISFLYK